MNYLVYIEHSAENLQFYLWHQNFVQRFREATTSDLVLAPEWTSDMEADIATKIQKEASENLRPKATGASEIFKDSVFEKKVVVDAYPVDGDPFSTPPQTPKKFDRDSSYAPSTQVSNAFTYRSQASDAFVAAGAQRPCE